MTLVMTLHARVAVNLVSHNSEMMVVVCFSAIVKDIKLYDLVAIFLLRNPSNAYDVILK